MSGDETTHDTSYSFEYRRDGIDPMTKLTVEMGFVREDITEIKESLRKLEDKPCPSLDCMDCRQRISQLEDHEKIVVGAIIVGVLGSGLLVFFMTKLFGG